MTDEWHEGIPAGISSFGNPGKKFGNPLPRANWAGNIVFRAARVHRPESIDSLRRIVDASSRIKALGSGHSFNAIADTAGDLVLLDGLPKTLTIDPTNSTVTLTSGMSYTELTPAPSSGLRTGEHGLNPADICRRRMRNRYPRFR